MDFESKYQSHLKKYTKTGISRLIEMAGQKKFLLYLSSIFAVFASLVSLIPYISVYKILEVLLRNYVFYSNQSRPTEGVKKDGDIMIKWGIISVIAFSVYIVFQVISLTFSHVAAFNILYNIRVQIAEHIGFLPLGYLNNTTTGAISKTLEENVENIELFIAHNIPDIVMVVATCIFSLFIFFHYNFTLTIVCLVVFIMALGAQFTGMFSKRSKEITVLFYDVSEKISGSVVQFIYGIPVVKIFGKTVFSFRKLADDLNKYRELSVECCYLYCPGMCLSIALIESFCAFIIPIGLLLLSRNEKDLALTLDYIFFIIMSPGLASPLFNLIMMSSQITVINEGNKRIDAILNEDIIEQPKKPKVPTKYNVTFKDVTFNYKVSDKKQSRKADEDVLSHVSFEAENGKITALVGPSGSGKSTIGSLIPRFWDVEEGEVCIGGINVKEITYPNLMNIISFVFQDTFLFNDTVYNNIAIGRVNATKMEVIAAAKAAQCHEFIESLPEKYDTLIGSVEDKEGLLLSGGEQQRICIARAILKNSPILVLDEATAYSDPENEFNIQLALKELIKDKTVIVIAHNLNTIKSADNIIVVKKGKIVEQGKHDYLLNIKNGLYHSMWEAYIHSSKWYITNKGNPNSKMLNDTPTPNDNSDVGVGNPKTGDNEKDGNHHQISSSENLQSTQETNKTEISPSSPQKSNPKKLYKEGGIISDNFNILYNISCGNPKKVYPAIFFTALANFINVLPFCLTIYVVQTVFESFDGSGTPLNKTKIWSISGVLLVYILVMYAAQLPAFHNSYTKAYESSVAGRMRLAEHIRKLPVGTIYAKDPGEMVSLLMNDFQTIETCSSHMIPQLFGALVMPIFAFISLLFVDWRLDLAAFLPFPIGLSILILATSLQNKVSLQQLFAKVEAGSSFKEYLKGIRCIKAYNLIGTKFDRLQTAFHKLMMESIKIEVVLGPIVSLCNSITHTGIFFMIMVGAYLLKNNDVKITTFVMFLVIGSRIFDPLVKSIGTIAAVRYSAVAGKRILKFLDLPIMEGKTGDVHYGPNKDIVFHNVNFKYSNEETSGKSRSDTKKEKKYDLQNINLTMKQGTLTALVGPSGSGKTTILKLISKFYDVDGGKITFAGEDISKIDPEFYMKNISIVFQDVYLFQDTIANNIRFGREDATMEDIIEVAKKACAHDFIMNLPNGYDTMVGEGGCTLSGGEKQRISIARAILKDSPVVLLDEATSSLDPENEVEVQKAISELIVGRTVIVISHHLKIITEADNIVVLEEGCVVEQGTHKQLLSNNGVYKRLWDIQEKKNRWIT
ncbi:hypothetical protein PIROE2DRAFT_10148 [Piromyces sp. E2]|nr:hypothetical protein PIROE2DRAFT_10148 [Piromyces sp. E2]|eukprot:OUM63361.1 hypothetical protein PIROE2DRAFT_10148 [Piromyces sp. E2]